MNRRCGVLFLGLAGAVGACAGDDDPIEAGPDAGVEEPAPTDFTVRIENVAPWRVLKAGLASTKLAPSPGPLGPGEAYEVTFTAGAGHRLSFASMLGESNDWFFAPSPDGIPLHDDEGNPISGDVTDQVYLWDAGTEYDQEPFVGDATGPKQAAPDAGAADPDATVHQVAATTTLDDGSSFARPAVADMIAVTVTPGANRRFTVRFANVSDDATLVTSAGARAVHASPFVWTLHGAPAPIFTEGAADRGEGLEQVAESGGAAMLAGVLETLSGPATPISPGVFAVHRGGSPLYDLGIADRGEGLERIAEDGNPAMLAEAMAAPREGVRATGAFDTPAGASAPGPARPGGAYEVTITGAPGDRLSFVTMFGISNDWFFASDPDGVPLFDADGTPIDDDVTAMVHVYDAGTEIDQELAIGPDTAPQQPAPDTGAGDPIELVREAAHAYPATTHLRVTITPVE